MNNSQLSDEGQQRRNDILTLTLEESCRLHRRRKRRRRFSATAASMMIVAALAWVLWPPAEQGAVKRPQVKQDPGRPLDIGVDLQSYFVKSEVDDMRRYLVPTRQLTPAHVIIDDAELLAALAELGQPDGIVRADGKTWLTSELDSKAL